MKIHYSEHEEKGWLSLQNQYPLPNTWVEISSINIMDWNLENMEYRCLGRLKIFDEKPVWLKKEDKENPLKIHWREIFGKQPTHWKSLTQEEYERKEGKKTELGPDQQSGK